MISILFIAGLFSVSNGQQININVNLDTAFNYDNKILIEEGITGKEIECAVLGNENPKASVVGEIMPVKYFYFYEAKYNDPDGAKLIIPAEIPMAVFKELQKTAIKAFNIACCKGMVRVDFFVKYDNTFLVNEMNTLPGFTNISMYPLLWKRSGISYTDLITELIETAIEK